MENDQRRYKRYNLDSVKINGKMVLADKFEIIDISAGGMALKTDKFLNIGKEYVIRLGSKHKCIDVRGRVVRCELSTIERGSDEEGVTIYTAAVMFQDVSPDTITDFINASEQVRKVKHSMTPNRRSHVRFYIVAPGETTLQYPTEFKVKKISMTGMLIEADQALPKESRVPMGLSLQDSEPPVTFTGRVASCQKSEGEEPAYEIGVEFMELVQQNKQVVETFVQYLGSLESKKGQ
jgi:c-di-GMP-binding flagellar brake protein YcgR